MVELDHLPDQKKYLSVKEAALLVGYTPDYVTRLLRDGKIDGIRKNRAWEIDIDSLKTFELATEAQKQRRQEELRKERLEEKRLHRAREVGMSQHSLIVPSAIASVAKASLVFIFVCVLGSQLVSASESRMVLPVDAIVARSVDTIELALLGYHMFEKETGRVEVETQSASVWSATSKTLCGQFDFFALRRIGFCERNVDLVYAIIPENETGIDTPHVETITTPVAATNYARYVSEWEYRSHLGSVSAVFSSLNPALAAIAREMSTLNLLEDDVANLYDEVDRIGNRAAKQSDSDRDDIRDAINDITHDTTLTGTVTIEGMLADGVGSGGTNGYVLQSTGTSTRWVATSTLGFTGGGGIDLTDLSSTATGLTYTNTTGVFSLTSGYTIPLTASTTEWATAYSWGDHSAAGYLTDIATTTVRNMFAAGTGLSYSTTTGTFANTGVTSIGGMTGVIATSSLHVATSSVALSVLDFDQNDYLLAANNLSDLTATSTARTNLGLGTIALLNAIDISDHTNLSVSATGLELSGDTLALTSGYTIPLSASTTEWATAYGWGDHALANYFDKDTDDTDDITEGSTNLFSQWATNGSDISYTIGNVGIGTSSPAYGLAVVDTVGFSEYIYHADNSNRDYIRFLNDRIIMVAGNDMIFNYNAGSLALGKNSQVYLQNGGNVGIGTTSPSALFTVGGTTGSQFLVNATGTVTEGTWNGTDIDISDYTNFAESVTGLELSGDTLALTAGYTIPLTASTTEWATAYGWGDHSTQGYLTDITNESLEDLSDVAAMTQATGDLLYWNGTAWSNLATSSLGITSAAWGNITGTLSNQTDLQAALDAKLSTTTAATTYLTIANNLSDLASSTVARTNLGLGALATLSDLSSFDTDDLTEGATNLYFTDARARTALSETITGIDYATSTGIFSLTSGYTIPLTASTTNWNNFYDTPSTRITAGDALTWSGNTLNFDGGASPAGELGGTWASPTVDAEITTLEELSDVDTFTQAAGNVLYWTGTGWNVTATSTWDTNTTYTAGDHLTLTGTDFDVDDDFLLNTGDTATGNYTFSGTTTLATTTITNLLGLGAIDATTETTIENALDTLSNLTAASSLATVGTITSGTWNGTDIDISDYTNFAESVTGLELSGDAIALSTGYSIPLTASTTEWATAYGWGDHSTQGYLASTDIDTSAELAAIVGDETGTGSAVFSASPTFTGTISAAAATLSSTFTLSGTSANIVLGSNYLSGDGGDEGVFVGTTGRVGIGNTATDVTGTTLDDLVVGNGGASQGIVIDGDLGRYGFTNGAGAYFGGLQYDGNAISIVEGTSEYLSVISGGNVGVGIPNPGAKFNVHNGDILLTRDDGSVGTFRMDGSIGDGLANQMQFRSYDSGFNTHEYARIGQLVGDDTDTSEDGALAFSTSIAGTLTERLRIDSVGNVGIGTTTPSQELTVAGDAFFTGALYDNANSAGSNGMVLQSDGSGFNWVATSSLGIGGLASSDIDTSAELLAILTDETGTGALVFGTSPSLTTPNLGTPSAATLTNATGLPVATGISGLGTGVATFLATPSSANLAAAVTGETGTGALVFGTSPSFTTQITTPLIQIDSNTTGVSLDTDGDGMLIIAGTANGSDEDIRINLDDTANTAVFTSATGVTVANFSGITLQESGINVLNNDEIDASSELLAIMDDETGTGSLVFSASPTFTGTIDAVAGDFSSTLTMSGTAANIALGSNYLSGDGGDEGIFVDANGKIGMGTTTPSDRLAVSGDALITDTVGLLRINSEECGACAPGTYYAGLQLTNIVSGTASSDGALLALDGNNDLFLSNHEAGDLFFETSSTTRMTIDSSGNVGIGDTTPAGLFTVGDGDLFQISSSGSIMHDVSSATYDIWIQGSDETTNGDARNLALLGNTTNDDLILNFNSEYDCVSVGGTTCTAALDVTGTGAFTGNVGIGIAPPVNSVLNVVKTSSGTVTDVALFANDSGNVLGSGARIYLSGSNSMSRSAYIEAVNTNGSGSAHDLSFGTNASAGTPVERMRIDSGGRVGIGRTPTTNLLEVAGDASKSTAGDWAANSDRRIKTEILDAGGLAFIRELRPVTFEYTDSYLAAHPEIDDRVYYNFIAQEFAEVFPDAVKGSGEYLPSGEEILQLDTHNAFITSIQAIKELDLMLADLATTTPFAELPEASFAKQFFGALITWFGDAANGIGDMFAKTFHAEEMICVGETCIDEEMLKAMLQSSGESGTHYSAPNDNETPEPDPVPPPTADGVDGDTTDDGTTIDDGASTDDGTGTSGDTNIDDGTTVDTPIGDAGTTDDGSQTDGGTTDTGNDAEDAADTGTDGTGEGDAGAGSTDTSSNDSSGSDSSSGDATSGGDTSTGGGAASSGSEGGDAGSAGDDGGSTGI